MKRIDSITKGWDEYQLIDSGDGRKLERFGQFVLDRPDPQAIWSKHAPQKWHDAHAHFAWGGEGEKWKVKKGESIEWVLRYKTTALQLSLGKFKHIGVFPEHEAQWSFVADKINNKKGVTVLNLFGYTGAVSLVAAHCGAKVTHVDASKQTIGIVKQNIHLSGLAEDAVRLVCEDALKYAKRLVQRGETFDMIVLDPPAFGRGPKGEIWKIEEKLPELIALIPKLISSTPGAVVLNGYAAGYSARAFGELLRGVLPTGEVVFGDVGIQEVGSERVLPTGIYALWEPK